MTFHALPQLKKLERLGARDGEAPVPLSGEEALLRLERVEDREAVEVLIRAGGSCAFENFLN